MRDPFGWHPGLPAPSTLYFYATLSRLVYQHDAAAWQQIREACFGINSVVDQPTAGVFSPGWTVLGGTSGSAVVVEGTTNTTQLLNQALYTRLTTSPGLPGEVMTFHHRANVAIYESIRQAVSATTGPITVTGHSLGGALAANVAWRLKQDFPFRSVRCLTFGAPRGGNAAWQAALRPLQTIRLENWDDPVPSLPPPAGIDMTLNIRLRIHPVIVEYRHTGQGWKFSQDSSIEIVNYEWQRATGWYPPPAAPIPLTDQFGLDRGHWMSEYIRRTRQRVRLTGEGPDAFTPCMSILDALNNALNVAEGRTWEIDPATGLPENWVNGPPSGPNNWWQGFLDGKPRCYPGG